MNGRWDRNLTIAVITAAAAILGAGVGAVATYYGNHTLQNEQSEATARGIARVLMVQLASAEARLKDSVEGDYLFPPDPTTSVFLTQEDEQLLAANLNAEAWIKVALALVDLQIEEKNSRDPRNTPVLEANAGRYVPLDPATRREEESRIKDLKTAFTALEPLAGS